MENLPGWSSSRAFLVVSLGPHIKDCLRAIETGAFDSNGGPASCFQSRDWRREESKSCRSSERKRIASSTGSTSISNVWATPTVPRSDPRAPPFESGLPQPLTHR
jgi:hypothetical protein